MTTEFSQASGNKYLKALNNRPLNYTMVSDSCPDYMLKLELLISMPYGVNLERPYSLKQTEEVVPDQNLWRMRYHPQGLLLVPHGSEDGSVVVGSHIRGSSLRSRATGYVQVDLLLPVTASSERTC